MFNAFELVMLLVSMFSYVTEANRTAARFLLEIVFSYFRPVLAYHTSAGSEFRQRNDKLKRSIEAYAMLCVILNPILGSLTVDIFCSDDGIGY
ncbi:hypothetical protein BDV93DRAFT_556764 [Ceratobasidium sp. AG-I]|nr:hypothetical protein BDV93DRAFT_556764 [Ceratobasidium sp. AG-I]